VLDKLRYRTMTYNNANLRVATPPKSTPGTTENRDPDDPEFHWFRDTWAFREGTTQEAEWQAAKNDALARLQRTDYGPDDSTGGFPPAGSGGYPYSWSE